MILPTALNRISSKYFTYSDRNSTPEQLQQVYLYHELIIVTES